MNCLPSRPPAPVNSSKKKLTPGALRGGPILGLAQSFHHSSGPLALHPCICPRAKAGSARVRTKVIHLSLNKRHIQPQLQLWLLTASRVLWRIPISVHISAYQCISVCTFKNIQIHDYLYLYSCVGTHSFTWGQGWTCIYFKRVCKHVSEYNSDVYSNQLDCETVGTQREEHNVVVVVF